MRHVALALAGLLLGCGASTTPPRTSPERGAPMSRTRDAPSSAQRDATSDARCVRDDDCVVTAFDCSECGRCPGDPPGAATRAALAAAEEQCRLHPPIRNDPHAAALGVAVPACQPCDGGPHDVVTLYRAACRAGQCIAEAYATEPVPPPGALLAPGALDVSARPR